MHLASSRPVPAPRNPQYMVQIDCTTLEFRLQMRELLASFSTPPTIVRNIMDSWNSARQAAGEPAQTEDDFLAVALCDEFLEHIAKFMHPAVRTQHLSLCSPTPDGSQGVTSR